MLASFQRMFADVLFVGGCLCLLHAAYSCLHYRQLLTDLIETGELLAASQDAFAGHSPKPHQADLYPLPPMDVWVECGMGLLLLLVAELHRTNLQPVVGRKRPLVAPIYVSRDFDIYTTRQHALGGVGSTLSRR